MNRLQTKCLMASTALHALLVVVLLVGPAFFVEIKKKESLPILEFIPARAVDEMIYGGGNPAAQPPPAVQPAAPPAAAPPAPAPPVPSPPAPVPPPPKRVEPPPAPEPPPVVKSVPKLADTPKQKVAKTKADISKPTAKKSEIKVNIDNVVTHKADDRKERQRREKEVAQAREAQETYERAVAAQARIAKLQSDRIDAAVSGLRNNLSSGTTVTMPGGFGGPSGPAFANYTQIIKSMYDQAWLVRDDILDTRVTVVASITVRRDGLVLSARITRPSGNVALDKSVQEALNRVRSILAFPEGATEVERTFKLNFNLQSKRATG